MEELETVELLRHADELDRRAGDVTHRKRRAAARVAIELGEHHPGQRQRIAERLGRIDRILSLHRVDDEQRLDRLDRRMQRADLVHHRLVDAETTGGVDDQHFVMMFPRIVDRGVGDVDRLLAVGRRKEIDADLRRQRFQLLDRGGTIDVGADDEHALLHLVLQEPRELAGGRRLARALQARQQDDRRRCRDQVERRIATTHDVRELALDHANQRLPRRQRADDFLADRAFANLGDEIADDRQRDVGLEQREAHFAERVLDVVFGQPRLTAQALDDAGQAISERVEHVGLTVRLNGGPLEALG